jgi:DNA-binding NarL/FixJ family response regulator
MGERADVVLVTDWTVLQQAWHDALAPRSVAFVANSSGDLPAGTAVVLELDRPAEAISAATRAGGRPVIWLHPDIDPSVALRAKRAGVTTLLHRSHGLAGLLGALDDTPPAQVRHLGTIRGEAAGALDMTQVSVLLLLSRGHTMNEVAQRLGISLSSVQRSRRSALDALGARSTSGAIARATELGLIGTVAGHTR